MKKCRQKRKDKYKHRAPAHACWLQKPNMTYACLYFNVWEPIPQQETRRKKWSANEPSRYEQTIYRLLFHI